MKNLARTSRSATPEQTPPASGAEGKDMVIGGTVAAMQQTIVDRLGAHEAFTPFPDSRDTSLDRAITLGSRLAGPVLLVAGYAAIAWLFMD